MASFFRSFSSKFGSSSSSSSIKSEDPSSNRNQVFKEEISFEDINQNIDNWVLPTISIDSLYQPQDKTWFSASDHVIRTVEESVSILPDKQDFYLLSPKSIERHKKKYSFLHIGRVQIAIKPLIRRGLNVSALVCLLDNRHNNFADSLLAAAEFGLHDGPVFFNCFPDRLVNLGDEHIHEVLKLKLKLHGLDMKPGSIPATLTYRVHYKVSNSSKSLAK